MILIVGAWAHSASAFDATGTWQGKWKCKQKGGDAKMENGADPSTMTITHVGNQMNIVIDQDGGAITFQFDGLSHDSAKAGKETAALEACGNDGDADVGDFAEVGAWKVVKDKMKGKSTWQDHNGAGTCKHVFKRTDAAAPGVGPCP